MFSHLKIGSLSFNIVQDKIEEEEEEEERRRKEEEEEEEEDSFRIISYICEFDWGCTADVFHILLKFGLFTLESFKYILKNIFEYIVKLKILTVI